MSRSLAFASGIPALVYQVAWTREVGLIAGSQIEAISWVLVAFFGGLAAGARVLGGVADRSRVPLRTFAALEIGAGLLAAASVPLLRALASSPALATSGGALAGAAAVMLPVTFLLGGTLPALVRHDLRERDGLALVAGRLTGANTAGSVLGVIAAIAAIPTLGLRASVLAAAAVSIAIGAFALFAARSHGRSEPLIGTKPPVSADAAERWSRFGLSCAAIVGIATLAYEVVAARMAAMLLGSSLYAWGAVLGSTLAGLAVGNAIAARRAATTAAPHRDLGRVEFAAAAWVASGAALLGPEFGTAASGLEGPVLMRVLFGVIPPAVAMGAAFPFLVRVCVPGGPPGSGFGVVNAVNTAGGIAGALLAPFVLLPALGPEDTALGCALVNACVGAACVARGSQGRGRVLELGVGSAVALAVLVVAALPGSSGEAARVIHVANGRQATAAVVLYGDRRDLIVDGDPEASTASNARDTEELLAILPLLLHAEPTRLLEVGLGSGITLGTAARAPLEHVECVEIAGAVLEAAPFFAPDNGDVTRSRDPRLHIVRGDGRAHLLRRPAAFDVVVANTLHPWSVGATGLYSSEYFGRLESALRPGGIAGQWLPLGALGEPALAAILRSFFGAFEHGALFWGADNVILIGSDEPLARVSPGRLDDLLPIYDDTLRRLSMTSVAAIEQRRIASGEEVLGVLGREPRLYDDRPALERRAAGTRAAGSEIALIERVAEASAGARTRGGLAVWLDSLTARTRGDVETADRLERVAESLGFGPARVARRARLLAAVAAQRRDGKSAEAAGTLDTALVSDPGFGEGWLARAFSAFDADDLTATERFVLRALDTRPRRAEAWNLLGVVRRARGDTRGATAAFEEAIVWGPHLPQALANAGLHAVARGNNAIGRSMLERLRALRAGSAESEIRALAKALGEP